MQLPFSLHLLWLVPAVLCAGTLSVQAAPATKDARAEKMRARIEARFTAADADKDGAISRAEFSAKGNTRFDEVDANTDDKVTREELDSFVRDRIKTKRAKKS